MATRVCPQCGSQYVASVRRCIECEVVLVDEVGPDGEAASPATATAQADGSTVAYELEGWGSQLKVTLEGMLDRAGIRRVWEAGALVVPAEHEAAVDELVATLEGGEAVDLLEAEEQIAFEIEGLTADELADLDARLMAAHIAHAWEDDTGALLVAVDDEETVAAMIDEVLHDVPADEGDDDGLLANQALNRLFVAVDKLVKDPFDPKLATRFREAGEAVAAVSVPYGLSTGTWDDLLAQISALGELIDAGPATGRDLDGDSDGDDDGDDGDEGDGEDDGDDEAGRGGAARPGTAREVAADLREQLRELV